MNHRNEIVGKKNGHAQSKRKPEHRHGNRAKQLVKKAAKKGR